MKKQEKYQWRFATIGGVSRVSIENGEDIAHLGELDQKLWTVLSCPIKGLEIDEKTLTMMDNDGDGKIRVQEIIDTADWLTSILKSDDTLLQCEGKIRLDEISQETENGKRIYTSAKQIIENLGNGRDYLTIDDTADSIAIFAKTKFNGDGVITVNSTDDAELKDIIEQCAKTIGKTTDRSGIDGITAEQLEAFYANCADYADWQSQAQAPYGDNSASALSAYNAIKDKIDDYFMRCKLTAFDSNAENALNVSAGQFEAISGKNLAVSTDEISAYPLARINKDCKLSLKAEDINPVWQGTFALLKSLCLDADFKGKKEITEAEWQSVGAKLAPYASWLAGKKGSAVEGIGLESASKILAGNRKADLMAIIEKDKQLEAESNSINEVDKLLHLCRDFYTLIKNFVTFADFYSKGGEKKAVFQAGTLYIDQRSCDLCIKVTDMAKQNAMAPLSGMFLIYCDCYSKQKNQTMTIVAVMTNGDIDNLTVGKNAIFYDRNGVDWDATVTKIVDNPISIRQAFWSPYNKFVKFIEDQINKFASNADSKITENATAKISETGTSLTATDSAETAKAPNQKQAFDIAKFCGIFAAIGMAIGYIGGFLTAIAKGFLELTWWKMPIAIIGFFLIISGPSMILAWMKLRKRNLSPILNANGWAINAKALVNIPFGTTLTKIAVYPKIAIKDPFAKKGIPMWRKILYLLIALIGIFAGLYFTNTLAKVGLPSPFHKNETRTETITTTTTTTTSSSSAQQPQALQTATDTISE